MSSTRKFALDIINHILRLHTSEKNGCFVRSTSEAIYPPVVLYNNFGKRLVEYYFANHRENIETFCSTVFGKCKLNKNSYHSITENMIVLSHHSDQCCQVFYHLCIKLTLMGFIAKKRGIIDALSFVLLKIELLTMEAYHRYDLDEKLDCMFNFAYDLLLGVFVWSGCDYEVHWDFNKLDLDSNELNYYDSYSSYFQYFFHKHGNAILNNFHAVFPKQEKMGRENFILQVQDWCDDYYWQLGEIESEKSLEKFLECSANIALLTVHAIELYYPCSISLALESVTKLAVSAKRNRLLIPDNMKLFERELEES